MRPLMEKLERLLELGGIKKDITLLTISGIAVVGSLLNVHPFPFDLAWVAIILCGVPIILEAIIGLVTAFDIKVDVLVSLALIAAVCIGQDFAASEVAFIMQLGGQLTVARARAGIEKLVHLTPQTARVIRDGKEEVIPAEQVKIGDRIRVLPGESVPVDGTIVSGQTSINQAVMTGESLPVDKTVRDRVSSGTVNQFGAFEMEAVTILVVFCPCALVLATPTAIMAAIGNATKHGFLVREGDALERLAKAQIIAFDKTGTLTCGTPEVMTVRSVSNTLTPDDIYRLAASAEQLSEHPPGKAIISCCKESGAQLTAAKNFQMIPGRGVCAEVESRTVLAGNPELLREHGIEMESPAEAGAYIRQGCTITYIAVDGMFAGFLALSDTLR